MNPFPNEAAARSYLSKITDPVKRQAARAHLVQYGYDLDEPSAPPAPVVRPAPQLASSTPARLDEVQATLPPPRPAQQTALQARGAAAASDLQVPGTLAFTLPYPPSVNSIWRAVVIMVKGKPTARILLSQEGRDYRRSVAAVIASLGHPSTPPGARLALHLTTSRPDARAYDLDNTSKALCDALTHAHVWADDSLVDDIRVTRGPVVPGGRVDVVITPLTSTLFEGNHG